MAVTFRIIPGLVQHNCMMNDKHLWCISYCSKEFENFALSCSSSSQESFGIGILKAFLHYVAWLDKNFTLKVVKMIQRIFVI